MKDIPISAAQHIAKAYGYDQIIIYGRKCDTAEGVGPTSKRAKRGGEHVTTYGVDKSHCDAAATIGNYLKKAMRWNV